MDEIRKPCKDSRRNANEASYKRQVIWDGRNNPQTSNGVDTTVAQKRRSSIGERKSWEDLWKILGRDE